MKFKLVFVFILILSFGCEKCKLNEDKDWEEGVIYFTGEVAVDGCGWLLLHNGDSFHMNNLQEEFMIDSLNVYFKGKSTGEKYNCGLSNTEYDVKEILDMKEKPREARFLSNYPDRQTSLDMFSMDSVYIEGDSLHLYVGYSGGCALHEFNLWILETGLSGEGEPHLMLEHISNGDLCEAYIRKWLSFSLKPLQETGKDEVIFWLRGSPEMSMLFGSYTYKY